MLYKDAGVDIKKGNSFAEYIKQAFNKKSPYYPDFAFGFDLKDRVSHIEDPFIVYSTDGIGTKIKFAIEYKDVSSLGQDLLAMCVNDILVLGAEPVIFLDYIAVASMKNPYLYPFIDGLLSSLKREGIDLGGGETAELPGLFKDVDGFDVAGFVVGIVSKSKMTKKENVKEGDVILGLSSSGVHSNGFSLIRSILTSKDIDARKVFIGKRTLKEELLTPTRIYTRSLLSFFQQGIIHGAAHITGGGIAENLRRTLHSSVDAIIFRHKIKVLPIFKYIKEIGDVPEEEMWNVFNMGIGFVIIVGPDRVDDIISKTDAVPIGEVVSGRGKVILR